jgi:hypothetical protein
LLSRRRARRISPSSIAPCKAWWRRSTLPRTACRDSWSTVVPKRPPGHSFPPPWRA